MKRPGLTHFLAVAAVALAWSSPSLALVALADSSGLVKNGNVLFEDEFDNGLTPSEEAHYAVFGAFPAGAESGGKLTIDSRWGRVTPNALGQARQTLNVVGLTGLNSSDPSSLGRSDTFSFFTVFDIVSPTGPLNNGYGIVFGDATSGSGRSLFLQVQYLSSAGGTVIRLYDQDFINGIITTLDEIPFDVPSGADQIALSLDRTDAGNTNVFGSYAFGSAGTFGNVSTFATPGQLFTTADFVRPRIQVYSAVPEPSSWALSGIALLALGSSLRGRRSEAPSV